MGAPKLRANIGLSAVFRLCLLGIFVILPVIHGGLVIHPWRAGDFCCGPVSSPQPDTRQAYLKVDRARFDEQNVVELIAGET
jgi:hypothetical protein